MDIISPAVLNELNRQLATGVSGLVSLTALWEHAGKPLLTPSQWQFDKTFDEEGGMITRVDQHGVAWAYPLDALAYATDLADFALAVEKAANDPVGAILDCSSEALAVQALAVAEKRCGGNTPDQAAQWILRELEARIRTVSFDDGSREILLAKFQRLFKRAMTPSASSHWDPASLEVPTSRMLPGSPSARKMIADTVGNIIQISHLIERCLRLDVHDVRASARNVNDAVQNAIARHHEPAWKEESAISRARMRRIMEKQRVGFELAKAGKPTTFEFTLPEQAKAYRYQIFRNSFLFNHVFEEWGIDSTDPRAREWCFGVVRDTFDDHYQQPGAFDDGLRP